MCRLKFEGEHLSFIRNPVAILDRAGDLRFIDAGPTQFSREDRRLKSVFTIHRPQSDCTSTASTTRPATKIVEWSLDLPEAIAGARSPRLTEVVAFPGQADRYLLIGMYTEVIYWPGILFLWTGHGEERFVKRFSAILDEGSIVPSSVVAFMGPGKFRVERPLVCIDQHGVVHVLVRTQSRTTTESRGSIESCGN
ncbi:MAG TPA: hypothetical protein VMZ31_06155 [Phycisphaerae bacterium]|nr:hypothetical protein [Phycisphaerae bacterium]